MKRCDFAAVQYFQHEPCQFNHKRETSQHINRDSHLYQLPGELTFRIDDMIKSKNEECSNSPVKLEASTESLSISCPSNIPHPNKILGSSSNQQNISLADSITQHKRVQFVSWEDNFLHYEISSQETDIDYCKSQMKDLIEYVQTVNDNKLTGQNSKNVLELLKAYNLTISEVENHLRLQESLGCILDKRMNDLIKDNLHRIRIKLNENSPQNLYMYSVFLLDNQRIFKQVEKGFSQNLCNYLGGSRHDFSEHILRFGDFEPFDHSSKAQLSQSWIQQIVKALQLGQYEVCTDNNIILQRFDGKQIHSKCKSSLVPISSDSHSSTTNHPLHSAFMHVIEVSIEDSENNLNDSFSGSETKLLNQTNINNNRQHEEYLKMCTYFQEKYYGEGSLRKKRYRKTKMQVEEELKYYLSLNAGHQQ